MSYRSTALLSVQTAISLLSGITAAATEVDQPKLRRVAAQLILAEHQLLSECSAIPPETGEVPAQAIIVALD
jgi:hypothetical protein